MQAAKYLSFILLLFIQFLAFSQLSADEFVGNFLRFNQQRPVEKVYLHTSREVLTLGDTIYFSAHLTNGQNHEVSTLSKLLYVELIAPNDKIIKSLPLGVDSLGRANGDFDLSDSLDAGIYQIRAYTNYQRNFDNDYFYTKSIKLLPRLARQEITQQERPEPSVNFTLFPEGGDIIAGQDNFVAFMATDEHGLPIVLSGEIITDKGVAVGSFETEHAGMGMFLFDAEAGVKYFCSYQYRGLTFSQALPDALEVGYQLHVRNTATKVHVSVKPVGRSMEGAFLVIQSRGRILDLIKHQPGTPAIYFRKNRSELPSGIIQLTFFDDQFRAVAERLIYNENPVDETSLNISVPKNIGTRSKVSVDFELTKSNGHIPTHTLLSTSIVPGNLFTNPESTIKSYMLLKSDLIGYIHDPNYYFDTLNTKRMNHVDLLMMTHGWRRFAWEQVVSGELPELTFFAEQGFTIQGKVTRYFNRNKSEASDLYLSFRENPLFRLPGRTDEEGNFVFTNLDVGDTLSAFIKTVSEDENKKEKDKINGNTFIEISQRTPPEIDLLQVKYRTSVEDQNIVERGKELFDIASMYDGKVIMLDELSIKAKKEDPFAADVKAYGKPSFRLVADSMQGVYMNVFDMLLNKVSGLQVLGLTGNQYVKMRSAASFSASGEPTYLLDGMPIDVGMVNSLQAFEISYIDVLKGPAVVFGTQGAYGVIAFYTRKGPIPGNLLPDAEGIAFFNLYGYYAPRQFYMPDYDSPSEAEKSRPDYRSTLYWSPIQEAENGTMSDEFYTSDEKGWFIIYTEGISVDGTLFTGSSRFKVE
jgi:hypothetical protein